MDNVPAGGEAADRHESAGVGSDRADSGGSSPGGSAASSPGGSAASSPGGSGSADDDRVEERAADLLPEERAAGSADPEAQAAAILEDSDEREAGLASARENRTSEQTVPPGDVTR
jgi:hypothetical protein